MCSTVAEWGGLCVPSLKPCIISPSIIIIGCGDAILILRHQWADWNYFWRPLVSLQLKILSEALESLHCKLVISWSDCRLTRGYTPGFWGSNYKPGFKISSCADTKEVRLHTLGCCYDLKDAKQRWQDRTIPAFSFGFIEIPFKVTSYWWTWSMQHVDVSINESFLWCNSLFHCLVFTPIHNKPWEGHY